MKRILQDTNTHVLKAHVDAACEIVLEKFDGRVEKAFDDETGLNLMQ